MADEPLKPSTGDGHGRLVVSPGVATSPLGDELAVLDTRNGEYFTMNGTGAFLWTKLQSPCSPQELLAGLLEAFEVDEATGRTEVDAFLAELLDAGLVRASDA